MRPNRSGWRATGWRQRECEVRRRTTRQSTRRRQHVEADAARSTYKLVNYSTVGGWAMMPGKSMYAWDKIAALDHILLRRPSDLDALKLFFRFISRRARANNRANISYDKICEYTDIPRAPQDRHQFLRISVPNLYRACPELVRSKTHIERAPRRWHRPVRSYGDQRKGREYDHSA
jgi:hypothetical protein